MTMQRGPGTAVFVTANAEDLEVLRPVLEGHHCRLEWARTRAQALPLLKAPGCGILLIDSDLPAGWKNFLRDAQALTYPPALIVVARMADDRLWAEVLNLGGYDVLVRPFDPREVERVISAGCRYWAAIRFGEPRGSYRSAGN
jgi:DNA-binding response OmpR family regulator